MNRQERAKQFAPFDALKGLREAMHEKELEAERVQKHEITDEMREEIQSVLCKLTKGSHAKIHFFSCGYYCTAEGRIKEINLEKQHLTMEQTQIPFENILSVELS